MGKRRKMINEILFNAPARIFTDVYPNAKEHKEFILNELSQSFAKFESGGQNVRTPFYWGLNSEACIPLLQWIRHTFQLAVVSNPPTAGYEVENISIAECWANRYAVGSLASSHNHFPYLYSFIYYLNVPSGSSPTIIDGLGEISAEEGKCVFFPSILEHSVPPTNTNGRITITGNFLYNKHPDYMIAGGNNASWNK